MFSISQVCIKLTVLHIIRYPWSDSQFQKCWWRLAYGVLASKQFTQIEACLCFGELCRSFGAVRTTSEFFAELGVSRILLGLDRGIHVTRQSEEPRTARSSSLDQLHRGRRARWRQILRALLSVAGCHGYFDKWKNDRVDAACLSRGIDHQRLTRGTEADVSGQFLKFTPDMERKWLVWLCWVRDIPRTKTLGYFCCKENPFVSSRFFTTLWGFLRV